MNKDIYNPRVAKLEQEISKLEKEILNGTYKMETTFHLDLLVEKINSLWEEYENIYNGIENPMSKKHLLEHLEKETDFLKLLTSLVKSLRTSLSHYKQVVGDFIETSVLEETWNDVKIVLDCNNKLKHYYRGAEILTQKMTDIRENNGINDIIYNQEFTWLNDAIHKTEKEADDAMNRIEEVGNATERITDDYEKDNEKVKTLSNEMSKMIKDAIPAIDRLYAVVDGKMIDYEADAEDFQEENRKDIIIDEEYLKTLSLVEQMEYIKLVMQNIINSKGKKRRVKYNGEIVSIPEKYYGKWIKCQTKMKECMREYEKEIVNPLLEEQNEEKYKEKYASLYSEFQQVNDRLLSLTENAKSYMNTNQVVAVASLNKEPLYVLKTSLNRFNTYFVEYKRLQKELIRFSERNNLKVPTIENIEKVEVAEKEIYSQIYLLKNERMKQEDLKEDTSVINTKIKELRSQLYQMNKGKRFAIFANLKVLFKGTLLAEDISTFYASVVENPDKLLKSKKYTDKEKESILKDILDKISRPLANAKDQEDKMKNTKKEQTTKIKNILVEQVSKVRKGINFLPKIPKKSFKIGNIRDAKNKKTLATAVVGVASACAVVASVMSFSNATDTKEVVNTKNIETNMEDNLIVSNSITTNLLKEEEISSQTSSMTFEQEYLGQGETNNLKKLFKEQEEKDNIVITPKKEETKEVQVVSNAEIVTPKEVEVPSYENALDDEYVDFGDTFTIKDKEIYQNYLDAAHEENALKASNPIDSVRVVDGITYEYNGEYIFISDKDEDAEAKKNALEANGAKQVNYRGANENGWEGYFVDENVTFTNEGRGR